MRYYGLVQKTEQSAGSGTVAERSDFPRPTKADVPPGPANFLATIAVEPEDRSKDEEVETWYRTEVFHLRLKVLDALADVTIAT